MSEAPSVATAAPGWDCHVHVFDAAAPVRPGHYVPGRRPLAEIENLAQRHGIGHLVIVQPSVYGTDNTVMLRALQASPGRHRGVAVVDADVSDADLDTMHAAGVRGVRFNLVSPAGHAGDVEADLRALGPRLKSRGWHVQWYVRAADLPRLVAWQRNSGLVFVLDHLAGLDAGLRHDDPAWGAAQSLADSGAWIKLSGWYRLGDSEPYAALRPNLERSASMFGSRTVWGSDWPHTSFAAGSEPTYGSTLAPVTSLLREAPLAEQVVRQPAALYR